MESKWYLNFYHSFCVLTPVFSILFLILLVYFGFVFSYCVVLMNYSEYSIAQTQYLFVPYSDIESANSKGLALLITVTFLTVMMLINFFRAIFSDPGFFKNPLELERKIVLKHSGDVSETLIKKTGFKFDKNPKKISSISNKIKQQQELKQKSFNNSHLYLDELNDNDDIDDNISHNQFENSNMNNNNNNNFNGNNVVAPFKTKEELEIKFLNEKFNFLCSFNEIASNEPLNVIEYEKLKYNISFYMQNIKNVSSQAENNSTNSNTNKMTAKDDDKDTIEIIQKKDKFPISEEDDIFNHFLSNDISKSVLCGTCLRWKVERSHHCRQCGKCVLKMDHHCPWLANCIGFRNYKFFLLIHFYGILASLIIMGSYWEAMIGYQLSMYTGIFICWFSLFVYLANFGLTCFLFWLLLVNWKLVFQGLTVIENADKERFPSTKSVNIYDLGYYKNFCSVFGNNPLVWFMPFGANYKGEGLVYASIYNTKTKD